MQSFREYECAPPPKRKLVLQRSTHENFDLSELSAVLSFRRYCSQGKCSKITKAKFRRRASHEPNRMLMRENKGFLSFAFDSAHVKYGVWTWPEHLNTLRGTRRLIRPIKTPSCFASLSEIKREITHLESMLAKDYCFLDKLPGTLARTFARYIYLWIMKTVLKNVSPTQLFFSSLEKTDDKKNLKGISCFPVFSTGCTLLSESVLFSSSLFLFFFIVWSVR